MAVTVDAILEEISQLSIEIHADYLAALEDRNQGKTTTGSVDDLLVRLGRDSPGVVLI